MFLISVAEAASDTAAPQGSGMGSLVFMLGFFAVLYWMIWRPQSKRAKEHRDMLTGISKGDEIITTGGILGKVTEIKGDFISLSVADNVQISIQKGAVSNVVPKGTIRTLS